MTTTHPPLTDTYACTGTLVLDGHAMLCPAWALTNLMQFWLPGPHRGVNVVVPLRGGTLGYPVRVAETSWSVPMVISGCVDPDGSPHPNIYTGIEANIAALYAAVVTPPGTADGARAATLTRPSGAVSHGRIQVRALTLGVQEEALWRATLDVTLPAGLLV